MKGVLFEIYRNLLAQTQIKTFRYLYSNISLDQRLIGIVGARGTGKTTCMLQIIKHKIANIEKCFYVSLDNLYFTDHRLIDFVKDLYETEAITYFFLDEVHTYSNWNQELKNIYDSFPKIHIIFSGSSSVNVIHGAYDLSRRAIIYHLHGLSFREYLSFQGVYQSEIFTFSDIIQNKNMLDQKVAAIPKLKKYFSQYLDHGYYPFFIEGLDFYKEKLFSTIEKTVYIDITRFYSLKTDNLFYFKKIITYIASLPPGELNRNSIAKHIQKDNKTVQNYLDILQDTGLCYLLKRKKSSSEILKPSEKIYLENPNLYSAISLASGYENQIGTIREIFAIAMLKNSGKKVFATDTGDIFCENINFEIGGKNKDLKQIKNQLGRSYLLQDDILYASKHSIPLYLLGFLY